MRVAVQDTSLRKMTLQSSLDYGKEELAAPTPEKTNDQPLLSIATTRRERHEKTA
ncbi:hypothetical protein YC2023_071375 [Brassica napus]